MLQNLFQTLNFLKRQMHDLLRGKLVYANIVLCLFVSLFFNAVIINFIIVVVIIIIINITNISGLQIIFIMKFIN